MGYVRLYVYELEEQRHIVASFSTAYLRPFWWEGPIELETVNSAAITLARQFRPPQINGLGERELIDRTNDDQCPLY